MKSLGYGDPDIVDIMTFLVRASSSAKDHSAVIGAQGNSGGYRWQCVASVEYIRRYGERYIKPRAGRNHIDLDMVKYAIGQID